MINSHIFQFNLLRYQIFIIYFLLKYYLICSLNCYFQNNGKNYKTNRYYLFN